MTHPKRITVTLSDEDWRAILVRMAAEAGKGRVVSPQDVLREAVRKANGSKRKEML
jgi:hypothetical protein